MVSTQLARTVLKDEVHAILFEEISSGALPAGNKMPSLKSLAKRFGTSTFTIRSALDRLEEKGWITRRHGSGTYVTDMTGELTLADSVVCCLPAAGHIYSDFHAMLLHCLHNRGRAVLSVDNSHLDRAAMLRRAGASDARVILVHGDGNFPFDVLNGRLFADKMIIGVLNWNTDRQPDLAHQVIIDEPAAGHLAVDHLWNKGCRRVVLCGTINMIRDSQEAGRRDSHYGRVFVDTWRQRGGTVDAITSQVRAGSVEIDSEKLLSLFAQPHPSTAVFGLRDVEVWHIQKLLLHANPEALAQTMLLGYGDTPWSQAGHPPFSTINWNLDEIAANVLELIERSCTQTDLPLTRIAVRPRLVLREES